MTFLNIQFPTKISFLCEGGPNFLTNVNYSGPGIESRNSSLLKPFSKYQISLSKINLEMKNELIAFFYITKGRFYSFRFKDFLDFSALLNNSNNSNLRNFFLIAEDQEFDSRKWAQVIQLQKIYSLSNQSNSNFYYTRQISKPVKSSIKFWENGQLKIIDDCLIDDETGKIYFGSKENLQTLDISFEFDVCVRFAFDYLQISNIGPAVFDSGKIELFEVFE
jgi:uncharacterized protein (TIGR02217 family)